MALKYAIIGTGAIGGFYGGMLAYAGKDVHFLLHSDFDYVKRNGLKIDSIKGNFNLSDVHAYNNTADMPKCDVVLVGLKSTNNRLLKTLLPPLLHKDTLVILIQNGLGLEEDLHNDFPKLSIAGGLAFICSNKVGPGYITHLDYGKLNIGLYTKGCTSVLEQVNKDCLEANIECDLVELERARWMKLVWNIPYNGMTVVLNTTTNELMSNPSTKQLLYDMILEVISAGNHIGKNRFEEIPVSFAKDMLDMTKTMIPYSPSMKLDYDFQRPLEIDYIYSRPIKAAGIAGFRMNKIEVLEQQLRFIQSQYLK